MASAASIRAISECFVKPECDVDESKKRFYLGSFELLQLSQCYFQIGLLFNKLPSKEQGGMYSFVERLKLSLSWTLSHFYPLAGQFVTEVDEGKHNSLIYVDCRKGPGVKFIHAAFTDDVTVTDISAPHAPIKLLESCFELGRVSTNYDAHDQSLVVIQVTELVDGVFLGASLNHAIMDGASFWHLLSSWSEIFRADDAAISRPPICERWFPEGYGPIIKIPYTHPEEFIQRYVANTNDAAISEVILGISSRSIAKLKAKANADCGGTAKITSIQALSALIWRAMVRCSRERNDEDDSTIFLMSNVRSKVSPPLAQDYLGNFIHPIIKRAKVGELLGNSFGWAALRLNRGVEELNDKLVRDEFVRWIGSPFIPVAGSWGPNNVLIAGVPRADVRGIEFGLGKAAAVRSGSNRYHGRVNLQPGMDQGSFSVEICLSPDKITAFEQDIEVKSFFNLY